MLTSLYLKHDSFLTSLTQYAPDYLTEYVISVPLLAVSRLNIGVLQGSVLESFFFFAEVISSLTMDIYKMLVMAEL